jgi:GNAT superfamily N-acetyltransferase
MATKVQVRPREEDDADALVALLVDAHAADGYPMRKSNVRREWLYDDAFERSWVALAGDVVVGHLALQRGFEGFEAATGRPAAETLGVTRLFVGSAARGLGAASALLDVADDYAASVVSPLVLDVVDGSTAAIGLYERRGWRRIGTQPADWLAPDGTHPIVHLYAAPVDKSRG